MKQFKFYLFLSVASALVVAGCKKEDFININPNSVTASTVDFRTVLPSSINREAGTIASDYKFLQNWMGYWARSGSFQNITDEETYDFQNDFNAQIWVNNYGIATNFDFVAKEAAQAGAAKYEGIARIMRAQNIQNLVDVYGNIPYFGAFQGNGNRTPQYDNARAIYVDLFRQLDTAIILMKSAAASDAVANINIAANDLVYQGDATKWVKYANTLKLRMIVHVFNVAGFDIPGEMARITTEGSGYIDAASAANINPGYTDTKPNPFYRSYVRTEAGTIAGNGNLERANIYAVGTATQPGYYQYNGDPRVDRFYVKPGTSTTHRGISFGEVSGTVPGNAGNLLSTINGPGLVPNGAASRAWIMTSAESFFLQAEARQRGYITTGPTAAALLRSGVVESFVFLGLTSTQADAYIAGNAGYPDVDINAPIVSTTPGAQMGGIYTILSQKWFALNAIATQEVWTDYRRTDIVYGASVDFFPGPPISVNPGNNSTKIPVRLLYPQSEYSYNATNVAAQGTINRFTSRIFWDIN